jgi:hypothetical protein
MYAYRCGEVEGGLVGSVLRAILANLILPRHIVGIHLHFVVVAITIIVLREV